MTSDMIRFGEIASALEDMHAVAIEGGQADLSADMAVVLAGALRRDAARLAVLLASVDIIGRSAR